MALDDLDLEFEDEEEAKKKKNDAVHQDVDLEFHTRDSGAQQMRTKRPGSPLPPSSMGQVKKLDEMRAAQAFKRPAATGQMTPRVVGTQALKAHAPEILEGHYDFENEEMAQLQEKVRKTEFDAEVRVQVAEFKVEILSELLGDIKLMDHQINQLLSRIHAKHPDMKQEALMIKKILADFTSKKRK